MMGTRGRENEAEGWVPYAMTGWMPYIHSVQYLLTFLGMGVK
jgi:hypothetical protein